MSEKTTKCWWITVDVERSTDKFAVLPSRFEFYVRTEFLVTALRHVQKKLVDEGWTIMNMKWSSFELIDIGG